MIVFLHFWSFKCDVILQFCNGPGTGAELSPVYESLTLRCLCAINNVIWMTDCSGWSSDALKLYSQNKL